MCFIGYSNCWQGVNKFEFINVLVSRAQIYFIYLVRSTTKYYLRWKIPDFVFRKVQSDQRFLGSKTFVFNVFHNIWRQVNRDQMLVKLKQDCEQNKLSNDFVTWNDASTILILLKLILMCSILVLRAMGSTSRVELAQTTLSLKSWVNILPNAPRVGRIAL